MGSESDQQQKLTKKQRKALAFRDKKAGKGKGKARPEPNALPELDSEEEQDLHKLDPNTKNLEPKTETQTLKAKGKRKAGVDDGDDKEDSETAANEVSQEKVTKKRKRIEDTPSTTVPEDDDAKTDHVGESKRKKTKKDSDENEDSKSKARYILFVGNLKYTTSKEAIQDHFSVCDPPPQIRLLTPKSKTPSSTPSSKSKGCAFLEFTHRNALQQALKLHHSTLDDRRINVELSAGGGGSGESRLTKIKARNKELASQRAKHLQKSKPKTDSDEPSSTSTSNTKAERHSSTSGADLAPQHKRTWTIPEEGDDDNEGRTRRGGVKHAANNRVRGKRGNEGRGDSGRGGRGGARGTFRKAKAWGTGVNAIPVG